MKNKDIKAPNIFLIGAPKSGTSALADAMSQHPDIFMGKKEPRFFDAHTYYDNEDDYPILTLDEYLELFSSELSQKSKFRLDASVFNMYSSDSIRHILSVSPGSKFIVMLRDPITAAKSMHKQRLKYVNHAMREISEDFCECWRLLEKRKQGLGFPEECRNRILFRYDYLYHYEWHLPKCFSLIDKSQLLILRYEDFKLNPLSVCKKVFAFINADTSFVPRIRTVNPSMLIENNLWNRFVSILIGSSVGPRKMLGLTGGRVKELKYFLFKSKNLKTHDSVDDCDEEMKKEFQETYIFLTQIKA